MRLVEQRIINRARLSRVRQCQTRRRRPQADEEEAEVSHDPLRHFDIADTSKENENMLEWVYANRSDIAVKV